MDGKKKNFDPILSEIKDEPCVSLYNKDYF